MNVERQDIVSHKLSILAASLEEYFGKDIFNFKDYYFAGGCIYSLWNGQAPHDYDVFCRSRGALKKIKKYFQDHRSAASIITENAITMGKFQFVTKHVGKPEREVAKFDFLHNCYWYDKDGLHALKGWDYLYKSKLLFNDGKTRDVLNVASRIPKFVERGMSISQKELLKILEKGTKPTSYLRERAYIKHRLNSGDGY